MKKTYLKILLFLFFFSSVSNLFASLAWTRMADFGGGNRDFAFGFSVGSYGYAGTGRNPTGQNDFWQYDPALNVWTQKAAYPGSGRYGMVGFAIGNYGYAGTGWSGIGGGSNQYNDFWQYDPGTNTWLQKANFGGTGRYSAVGFAIGNKGYIGLGYSPLKRDFWEYDPVTDTWTPKADFPMLRQAATGFAIGNKGYIGTGYMNGVSYTDFYEFDPLANTWTQKSDVPGLRRRGAVGFTIGNYGYLGMGYNDSTYLTDFSRYDPVNNVWTVVASIGGVPRYGAYAFSLNNYGYVGTGSYGGIIYVQETPDFWRLEDCQGGAVGIMNNIFKQKSISMNVSASDLKGLILDYDLGNEREVTFSCYDALGKLVVSANLLPNTRSMTLPVNLSEEIYFYTVKNPEGNLASGKVMVY